MSIKHFNDYRSSLQNPNFGSIKSLMSQQYFNFISSNNHVKNGRFTSAVIYTWSLLLPGLSLLLVLKSLCNKLLWLIVILINQFTLLWTPLKTCSFKLTLTECPKISGNWLKFTPSRNFAQFVRCLNKGCSSLLYI